MWKRRSVPGCYLLLCAALTLGACSEQHPGTGSSDTGGPAVARIEGQVFYRERMLLPPGAQVEVELQDISRADAMATVLASVLLTPDSGPPYPFVIEYDPDRIDSRMSYGLRATITVGDRLMFTTTEHIDPFGQQPLEVLVRRVPESVKAPGPSLEGTLWILDTLGGEAAATGAGGKPVDLQFSAEDQRAGGFSGCNRYTGGYSRDGASQHGAPLGFSQMASTMMACPEGGELEQAYLQMLGRVDAFRLEGSTLSLLQGPEVLATFRAQ